MPPKVVLNTRSWSPLTARARRIVKSWRWNSRFASGLSASVSAAVASATTAAAAGTGRNREGEPRRRGRAQGGGGGQGPEQAERVHARGLERDDLEVAREAPAGQQDRD